MGTDSKMQSDTVNPGHRGYHEIGLRMIGIAMKKKHMRGLGVGVRDTTNGRGRGQPTSASKESEEKRVFQ